jgi:hypothetical protein
MFACFAIAMIHNDQYLCYSVPNKLGNSFNKCYSSGGWTSRLPHFVDNQLKDGGEVASRPLPPGRFLVLISVRG